MALFGKSSVKCSIKFLSRIVCVSLFCFIFTQEAKGYTVELALPDPLQFVQSVEEQAFEHLGQIMGILVTLVGLKWLLQALRNMGG